MIVPLNLVMTYPVRWGRYKIFRDFVQNFYDSVGYRKWNEKFHYEYSDQTLRMWIDDVHFSYEWLLHIGASTKTMDPDSNAGYFGEGFKIASLCALRDHHWTIRMSSDHWSLEVMKIEQKIDGREVQMLAYQVEETEAQNCSCLTLSPISEEDYSLFLTVLYSFYYPENPLLGEKVWESSSGAVYTRGNGDYLEGLPYTSDFGRRGVVFCCYQLLGSNPFPLVVCLHHFRKDDRERNSLYSFQVVDCFKSLAYLIDPYGAMVVLEKMRRYWNSLPKKHFDFDSWSSTISALVKKVGSSAEITEIFRQKHPNLLCLEPVRTIRQKNRRAQARAWLTQQEEKYLLVQSVFLTLGYETLESRCEKMGGFVTNDSPNEKESQCFSLLEQVIKENYTPFFLLDRMPDRRIIANEQASYHGMARVYRKTKPVLNCRGVMLRYDVGEIYVKRTVFRKGGFFDALATYLHELCHAFGGDSSNAFSQGLTYAMEILLSNAAALQDGSKRWDSVFDSIEINDR